MSESNFSILPNFIDNMFSPVAAEAGESLADIIRIARIPLTSYLKKHEVKLEVALSKLRKELNEIPEENMVLPKTSVVGPAMEDLFKYHLEEEQIVDAFAKLIAASMDRTKCDAVHPHLFHAVRQMSPLDSYVFKSMQGGEIFTVQPYAAFYMSGMPFPSYQNYEIVLFSKDVEISGEVERCVKAFDSLQYLATLGLVAQGRDREFDSTSEKFCKSELCADLKNLIKIAQHDTISSLTLAKKIILHPWHLTNWGYQLAFLLGLTKEKFSLYGKYEK